MMRNYLGFFWLLWLAVWPVQAAEVLVGDLALRYGPPWERAQAQEEDAEHSTILRWPAGEVTVFLPHHQVALKTEEARFHRQLEQQWRALYGADVRIYPMEVAGTTWRVCRRPSLGGEGTVFQLVHVHEGRAHHLLAIAAGRLETLPAAVQGLVATARWEAPASLVLGRPSREDLALQEHVLVPVPPASGPAMPAQAPAATAAPEPPTPVAVAAPEPVATAAVGPGQAVPAPPPGIDPSAPQARIDPAPQARIDPAPAAETRPPQVAQVRPAPPEPAWRLARVVHALPRGARLAELAEAETRRLGEGGMLTGYGLSRQGQGLQGFVEGYRWQDVPGQRPLRQAFARRWQLAGEAPRELRPGETAWTWAWAEQREGMDEAAAGLAVRLEVTAVCGPRRDLVAAFDGLEKGDPGGRLAGLTGACPRLADPSPATTLTLRPGAGGQVTLVLPPAWTDPASGRAGSVKRLVVSLSHRPGEPAPGLGDSLLGGLRSYYIYVPRGE
jgi:hypothetical protein